MTHTPPSRDDILASATATALPSAEATENTRIRQHFQAVSHMNRVFAIKPGEKVVLLTDPLLDRRVVDAVSGIAAARGARDRGAKDDDRSPAFRPVRQAGTGRAIRQDVFTNRTRPSYGISQSRRADDQGPRTVSLATRHSQERHA